jgi:hypothetical protein
MKRTLLLSLVFILFNTVYSQAECLSLPVVQTMGLRATSIDLDDAQVQTLPLVFHIVHTGLGEVNNISNEQVLSAVEAANEHFRGGEVDTKIEFCLAQRDPQGNPTIGIERYDASGYPEYVQDGVAPQSTQDGLSDITMKSMFGCWNVDDYINIYVVSEIDGNNANSGTQGYAYLGPTGDCRDGVVVLYNVTGTVGELKPGRDQSKTLTHELGHYLTLYHTFFNSNDCVETSCETQGDRICDTPPTTTNYSCTSSCPEAMVENFMDYTPQDCKTTFSVGQAERMHDCLLGAREDLPFSAGCVPSVEYDATIASVMYETPWCSSVQDIWVTVVNQGSETMPWVDVDLYCNGNQTTWTVPNLGPGQSEDVLFEQVYVQDAQLIEVQVFSTLDQYEDNDYMGLPFESTQGTLASIEVAPDYFASECSWELVDSEGEIVIGDEGYPNGNTQSSVVYTYYTCLSDQCYTLNAYDTAGDGMVLSFLQNGSIGVFAGLDTLAWIADEEYYQTSREFCNTLPACPLDYDGNGTIGNGDILVMLSYYGCEEDCPYDPDQDGFVTVRDLLYMLWNIGDCPLELDFSPATYIEIVATSSENTVSFGGKPQIYDMLGRKVQKPFDQLASGVYILKWKSVTKKVFVQ